MTNIDVAGVAGINGVAWDAVELPSQLLENWCWQEQSLRLFAKHHQTGAALPESLLQKMLAAKNFQAGMFVMRQLEFALFDLRLHMNYNPAAPQSVQSVLNAVRAEVAVVKAPSWNRFQHGFAHIFAGGYASGYYACGSSKYEAMRQQGIPATKKGKAPQCEQPARQQGR